MFLCGILPSLAPLILTNMATKSQPEATGQAGQPSRRSDIALRKKYNERHEQITRNLDRIREILRDHKMASEHNPENDPDVYQRHVFNH